MLQYKLEQEQVPKLILGVPLDLFSPRWIQYHCYDLRLLCQFQFALSIVTDLQPTY